MAEHLGLCTQQDQRGAGDQAPEQGQDNGQQYPHQNGLLRRMTEVFVALGPVKLGD